MRLLNSCRFKKFCSLLTVMLLMLFSVIPASAAELSTDEKAEVERRPFTLTGDYFPKIVVRKDIGKRWYDDNGILNVGVIDFLLDDTLV